ncbi:MAG: hypothetical protein OK474_12230 [Thaumarchaeota archaeon]|nr:hypothetical protein [Nitrososphaerota archaeon]
MPDTFEEAILALLRTNGIMLRSEVHGIGRKHGLSKNEISGVMSKLDRQGATSRTTIYLSTQLPSDSGMEYAWKQLTESPQR